MTCNPDSTGKIEKNLMIHDQFIPIDLNLYKREKLLGILNTIGLGLLFIR